MNSLIRFPRFAPTRVIIFGYLIIVLIGGLLLSLPVSASDKGNPACFVDALFTATSATCVTGLIVKDTPRDWSPFGKTVILLLIQIGGLGYMTIGTTIVLLTGRKLSLRQRLIMKEALNILTVEGLTRFVLSILLVTFIVESLGTLILTLRFARDFPLSSAFLQGLFHSVSAFNNAGFSLFSTNFMGYRGDLLVTLTITALIVTGGIGFIVINELYRLRCRKIRQLSVHAKTVLTITGILILAGTIAILLLEWSNPLTLKNLSWKEKILASYFQAVTPRTAGFNTLDIGALNPATLLSIIALMLIGASPGGTGGGIKTSTFAAMIKSLATVLRGKGDVVVFRRRLSSDIVLKSFIIGLIALLVLIAMTGILIIIEKKDLLSTTFEVASALGTVGLSTGDGGVRSLAAIFSNSGKIILITTMLIGRAGLLTAGLALMKTPPPAAYRHPEGKIIIG
jgi:trk system potassium uptake protein TrkH